MHKKENFQLEKLLFDPMYFTLNPQNECTLDSLQSNKKNKTLETQKQVSNQESRNKAAVIEKLSTCHVFFF